MIEGLRHIVLEVADLDRSVEFYRRGLRFATAPNTESGEGCAHLTAGTLHLLLVERAEDDREQPDGERTSGIRLALAVSGVDAYHDALVARGIAPTPPVDDKEGRSFSIEDPDGFRWRVAESR